MGRAALVDVFGWILILTWVGLSIAFGIQENGAMFQAVGVVGISAGVAYFVIQRYASPYPYGSLELDLWRDKRIEQTADACVKAHASIALLAKVLEREAKSEGRSVPSEVSALAAIPLDKLSEANNHNPQEAMQRFEASFTDQLSANESVEKSRRRSEVLQAVIVVLGTLQSGLGEALLHTIGGQQ